MRFLCLAFVLLWPMAAVAADFNAGVRAFKRGDYATAMHEWRPLAERGHVEAQYNFGLMYVTGEGVPKDAREAAKWFRKAANQGSARAQYDLGLMYAKGDGVPKDYVQAYVWSNLTAAQGNANGVKLRSLLEKSMRPSQIARAQSLSTALALRIDER